MQPVTCAVVRRPANIARFMPPASTSPIAPLRPLCPTDPCLACDLGQQPWRVLACNAAAAALADLPEPLPQELPFCSLFELEQGPGAPGNANHQAATAQGQPFMLTCRLRPAEDRPSECSASGGAAGALGGQPHDAAAAAPRWVSGPDILLHSDPASSADGHAPVRAASGDAAGLQLPALRERQPGAAAADDLQAVDGGGTQAGPPWEPLVARGSLDSALPAVKHITAPDQVFSAAFAAYLPAELGGSTGEGVPTTGQPSIWLATLCPINLAAMAAQARLGLLIGRHQLPQVQGGTAAAALGSLAASTTRLSSPDRAGRPRSTSVPRVLLPQSMQGVELGPLLGVGASGRCGQPLGCKWAGATGALPVRPSCCVRACPAPSVDAFPAPALLACTPALHSTLPLPTASSTGRMRAAGRAAAWP